MIDEREYRREMRRRNRQRVVREFWRDMQNSTWESATDILRWMGYILVFVVVITLISPH